MFAVDARIGYFSTFDGLPILQPSEAVFAASTESTPQTKDPPGHGLRVGLSMRFETLPLTSTRSSHRPVPYSVAYEATAGTGRDRKKVGRHKL
jgi:hypothetical protein